MERLLLLSSTMSKTNAPERDVHPDEKSLTEQSVPGNPTGGARWILGLLSLLPLALLTMAVFFRLSSNELYTSTTVPLIGIYGLIGSGLSVLFFIVLALKSPYLDTLQRLGWTALMVFLAPLAMPAFWYRNILHPLRYGRPPSTPEGHAPIARRRSAT